MAFLGFVVFLALEAFLGLVACGGYKRWREGLSRTFVRGRDGSDIHHQTFEDHTFLAFFAAGAAAAPSAAGAAAFLALGADFLAAAFFLGLVAC